MIIRNHQNRKMRVDLRCPTCGLLLTKGAAPGFVRDEETFCCQGCADGTGCTCEQPVIRPKKAFNRPGDIGQRNPENSARDRNANQEVTTTGVRVGNRRETEKAPSRIPSRGKVQSDKTKLPRGQAKERDSTREQARGRSEFRGALGQQLGGGTDRTSRTGTKSR